MNSGAEWRQVAIPRATFSAPGLERRQETRIDAISWLKKKSLRETKRKVWIDSKKSIKVLKSFINLTRSNKERSSITSAHF